MTLDIDDNLNIDLQLENGGLRVITKIGSYLVRNQTYEETKSVIEKNYKIVKDYYQGKANSLITEIDLENFSLKIVLNYFYMYNMWRTMYKREKNRDLTFLPKDFEHPTTSYLIINYFQKQYPNNYADKCELLLNMSSDRFLEYMRFKEQFDNK
ncbi:hypothetical protein [Mucilaginibacter sp.]|uniref:hypothetical protein n=1 Tax=Mucilaginibacter sp. TaxID=1882438 RepID=UPI0025DE3DFF|nr:hypothetical protein [Mucilaginibacter sp.]